MGSRYGGHKSFLGISLLNEGMGVGVPLGVLKKYYLEAYKAVRKHSPCGYVGIAPRYRRSLDELSGFMAGNEYSNVVLDLHSYVTHDPRFNGQTTKNAIDHIREAVRSQIERLQDGGRQVVIGEWAIALKNGNEASDKEFEEFTSAQLEVYSEAKAGWFFWSHKMGREGWPHWSFRESVTKGWLPFKVEGN